VKDVTVKVKLDTYEQLLDVKKDLMRRGMPHSMDAVVKHLLASYRRVRLTF